MRILITCSPAFCGSLLARRWNDQSDAKKKYLHNTSQHQDAYLHQHFTQYTKSIRGCVLTDHFGMRDGWNRSCFSLCFVSLCFSYFPNTHIWTNLLQLSHWTETPIPGYDLQLWNFHKLQICDDYFHFFSSSRLCECECACICVVSWKERCRIIALFNPFSMCDEIKYV